MCEIKSTRSPKRPLHRRELKRTTSLAKSGLWIIALGVMLTACSKGVDAKADLSFVTDEPCAAPCWYGLTLNESTKADLQATLKSLEFVDPNDIRDSLANWAGYFQAQWVWWGCLHPAKRSCGEAVLVDDRLKYLTLDVNYPLTLGEVVTKLGDPEYVEFGEYHFEVGGCGVRIFWPTVGIIVSYVDTRREDVCKQIAAAKPISPDLSISVVEYSASEGFEGSVPGCCTRIAWPGMATP
jgi:hypothetical protein